MHEGSIHYIVQRLMLYCARRNRGLGRIECDSDYSRSRVLDNLRPRFGSDLIEIVFPGEGTAFESVNRLVSQLNGTMARVASITWVESGFTSPEVRLQLMAALTFRRESLASIELIQLWWMPSTVSEEVVLETPDLDSWFQLRLRLA